MTDEAPALVAAGGPPVPAESPRTRVGLVGWAVSILVHAALIAALADLSDRLGSEPEDEVISAEWVIDAPLREAVAVNAAEEAPRAELPPVAAEAAEATRLALVPTTATALLEAAAPDLVAAIPATGMLAPTAPPADAPAPRPPDEAPRPVAEPTLLAAAGGGGIALRAAASAPLDAPALAEAPKAAATPAAPILAPTRPLPAETLAAAARPADAAIPQRPVETPRPVQAPPALAAATASRNLLPQAAAPPTDAPAAAGPPQPAAVPPAVAPSPVGQTLPAPAPAPPPGLAPVPSALLAALSAPGAPAPVAAPAPARPALAPESLPPRPPAVDVSAPRPESGLDEARPVAGDSVVAVVAPPALLPREDDPRQAIAAETLDLACGRVAASFAPEDGTVTLSGHLRSEQDRAAFVARLQALAGVRRVAEADLHIVGEPYCRVLGFLSGPGLARSEDQRHDLRSIGQPAQAGVVHIRAGRPLELQLGGPDFASFVYVDYFTADGRVYHLLPTAGSPENRLGPEERLALGGRNGRGLKATIGPPFGLDMVVAVAATRPVFPQVRPVVEDAAAYLAAFEAALAAARRDEGLRVEYSYFLIRTTPE